METKDRIMTLEGVRAVLAAMQCAQRPAPARAQICSFVRYPTAPALRTSLAPASLVSSAPLAARPPAPGRIRRPLSSKTSPAEHYATWHNPIHPLTLVVISSIPAAPPTVRLQIR